MASLLIVGSCSLLALVSIVAVSSLQSASFSLVRSACSILPRRSKSCAHFPSAQMYAPRPGIFPVRSIFTSPSGDETMRINSRFAVLLPQRTHRLSGMCRFPSVIDRATLSIASHRPRFSGPGPPANCHDGTGRLYGHAWSPCLSLALLYPLQIL